MDLRVRSKEPLTSVKASCVSAVPPYILMSDDVTPASARAWAR